MKGFIGFDDGPARMTPVPEAFFRDLLPSIDHLAELKLTLIIIWRLAQQEGKFRFVTLRMLSEDEMIRDALPQSALQDALERAVARGTLIAVQLESPVVATSRLTAETYYFLNTQRGRAAAKGLSDGTWNPLGEMPSAAAHIERPNIFTLYEQNIGPLTPVIADLLRAAAEDYSDEAVAEAIRIAVENNARSWRYIAVVLEGRAADGRRQAASGRGERSEASDEERRKYVEGDYADFIEH